MKTQTFKLVDSYNNELFAFLDVPQDTDLRKLQADILDTHCNLELTYDDVLDIVCEKYNASWYKDPTKDMYQMII